MSIFAETKCNFSPVSTEVYTALIHQFTCRFEARQALIYQLVLGLTGENGKYNYSRAVHVYPLFFDITCSAKNYKIAPALTAAAELAQQRAQQSEAVKKSRQKMYADAAAGDPEAQARYERFLATRRENYHRKKQAEAKAAQAS